MVADLPPKVAPPQFSLRELFIGITVLSVCLAIVVWIGLFALPVIYVSGLIAAACFRWVSWTSAITVIVLSVLLIPLFDMLDVAWMASAQRVVARRNSARRSTQLVGICLELYKAEHGEYPPMVTRSPTGEALHSWRALILPHLEREDLFEQIDFAEPWDGPSNSQLHPQNIKPLRGVFDSTLAAGEVAYLAVIMPNAKAGEPFAVIELPNAKVNYLEPRDITLQELDALAAKAPASGRHQDGTAVFVIWPDGDVELINLKEVPAKLRERMGE